MESNIFFFFFSILVIFSALASAYVLVTRLHVAVPVWAQLSKWPGEP